MFNVKVTYFGTIEELMNAEVDAPETFEVHSDELELYYNIERQNLHTFIKRTYECIILPNNVSIRNF